MIYPDPELEDNGGLVWFVVMSIVFLVSFYTERYSLQRLKRGSISFKSAILGETLIKVSLIAFAIITLLRFFIPKLMEIFDRGWLATANVFFGIFSLGALLIVVAFCVRIAGLDDQLPSKNPPGAGEPSKNRKESE